MHKIFLSAQCWVWCCMRRRQTDWPSAAVSDTKLHCRDPVFASVHYWGIFSMWVATIQWALQQKSMSFAPVYKTIWKCLCFQSTLASLYIQSDVQAYYKTKQKNVCGLFYRVLAWTWFRNMKSTNKEIRAYIKYGRHSNQ